MALKWLRDQLKYLHWVLYVIVFAFIVTLFFDFGTIQPSGFGDDDVAATVGSETISYADYRREVRDTEDRFRQAFGDQWTSEMSDRFNLSQRALNQLVDRQIRLLEAQRMGLRATDEEVRAQLVEMFSDADGFIGRDRLKQALRRAGWTEQAFSEAVRGDILTGKLLAVLRHTAYVSDDEILGAYRDEVEKATIRYVSLAAADLEGAPTVSDAELQAYYEESAAQYELPEQRVVDYLLVDRGKLRQEVEIPEAELRAYYDANPEEFTREEQVSARQIFVQDDGTGSAEAEAAAIKARIEAGEDFGQLARELSDDEGSAQRGGALGYITRGRQAQAFDEAAFAASKGELVGPVEGDFGYYIIEVLDTREGGLRPFEEVERLISSRLVGEQVQELAEQKARELAARIESEDLGTREGLETIAGEQEYLTFATTPAFGRDDVVAGLGRSQELNTAAFELEPGGVSEPVQLPRGWAILRLDTVNAPRVQDLDEVRDDVRQKVEEQKRQEMAVERLAEARQRVQAGESFDDVAAALGLEITTSEPFGRLGSIAGLGRQPAVIDEAMSLSEGELSEPVATDSGAVLFEVVEREEADLAELETRRDEIRQQLAAERAEQIMSALIQQRRLELSPQYDSDLAEELGLQQAAI